MNNKYHWVDESNSERTYVRYTIMSNSVRLSIFLRDDKWITHSNINQRTQTLKSIDIESAKKEAIGLARAYAEVILNEICKMSL